MHINRPLLLVVDDEEVVLTYISNALRTRQCDFILAEDGERGLELFRANKNEIDLVLTDVAMPRMSGPEMVGEIRRADSDVKLIFMTGFSPSQVIPQEFGAYPWLRKPFAAQELFEAIDHCLNNDQRKRRAD
jgi:two-component system cell cycle sensor histidine kinase/response regulator CckA